MNQNYNFSEIESKWQSIWKELALYEWDENIDKKDSFIIDTPPPTVSGLLHMGHVFSYTQTDIIARFMRMFGKNVFYPIGFDDNGLATERLVEKIKGIKGGKMHRDEFRKVCTEVVEESEEEFRKLFRSLALSVDWRQEYRTISEDTIAVSQLSFIDLYNKGHAERRLAPTVWDPVDQTAIAQAEIEDKEKDGIFYDINFDLKAGGVITIATTRPELIPACSAILVHPDDERYTNLVSKEVQIPVFGRTVAIIADHEVDIEKGTGAVMCCTFGDIQDVTWVNRHNLAIREHIDTTGKMVNCDPLSGLYVKEARVRIVELLKGEGRVIAEKAVKQMVKCAERSGAPLEYIPTKQWYIKLLDKKEELLTKGAQCNWHPEYMKVRFDNWVKGLSHDWCISRQRYFGVPFPVWYSKRAGEEGKVILAAIDELPVDPTLQPPKGYTMDEVTPETDVMDTWATSSLTPNLNSRAINDELGFDLERHKKLYPADLRPQAHEIIRTWAFYTIAKSMLHANSTPWTNLMISGWCLAADKSKMSKSKGNTVTPVDLIQSKGVDVIRYWASHSKLGVDIAYSEDLFKIGSRFITKLWNASKFVSIHFDDSLAPTTPAGDVESGRINCESDLWIMSKLAKLVEKTQESYLEYEYCDARVAIESFVWNDLCDNYLELIKARIYDADNMNPSGKLSAKLALYHVFSTILRLLAPVLPHVCDEISAALFKTDSIARRGAWPKKELYFYQEKYELVGEQLCVILEQVRKYKSERKMSIKAPLAKISYSGAELSESATFDLRTCCSAGILENIGLGDVSVSIEE